MTECSNSFFCLQKRRGQGEGRSFAAKVIGTLDNIRDARPPPFRILLQTVRLLKLHVYTLYLQLIFAGINVLRYMFYIYRIALKFRGT